MSLACPIIGGAKLGRLAKESLCFNPISPSSLPPEASSTQQVSKTSDHALEKGD